jgi:hypothetical protein
MGKVEGRFRKAGLIVRKLESVDEIKNNSWVLPNNDKEGMIRLRIKWFSEVIRKLRR